MDMRDQQPGYAVLCKLYETQRGVVFPLREESKGWYYGYLGERTVGQLLEPLRAKGFTILHGLPFKNGHADIDHLVVTPSGIIYLLNTKNHFHKQITVYDHCVYIGSRRDEDELNALAIARSRLIEQLFPVRQTTSGVHALLVYVNSSGFIDKTSGKFKRAIRAENLLAYLLNHEPVAPNQVDTSRLCRPWVWRDPYDLVQFAGQEQRLAWFKQVTRAMRGEPYEQIKVATSKKIKPVVAADSNVTPATPRRVGSPAPTSPPFDFRERPIYRHNQKLTPPLKKPSIWQTRVTAKLFWLLVVTTWVTLNSLILLIQILTR